MNDATRLDNGDRFPGLTLATVGGGPLVLPDALEGSYGVVLVYRGSWCPYCVAQLGSFSRSADALEKAGIKVVALSVDDEATSAALVEARKIPFPVAHSADPDQVSSTLGSYVNEEPRYLQSTGFVLAPDGTVLTVVYSSGAIGRLVVADVIGFLDHVRADG